MDIRFTFEDTVLPDALGRLEAAMQDFTPVMADIASMMEQEIRHRFETATAPDGSAWKPSQRAARDGGKTLIDKTVLLSSISAAWDATSATAGTNVEYGAYHQLGVQKMVPVKAHSRTVTSLFGRVLASAVQQDVKAHSRQMNMPAREFLGFGEAERREIPLILGDHLRAAFAGNRA